jgi:hypothetical protein
MSFSVDHIGVPNGHSPSECVVICPLALPDAGWPEGLRMLSAQSKQRIASFLENRAVTIKDVSQGQATQNQSASELVVTSLLEIDSANRLAAFAFPSISEPPYLAIRPVTLHAGRDHVVLKQGDAAQASAADLAELAAAVAPLFEAMDLKLHSGASPLDTRWFVSPLTPNATNTSQHLAGFFELAAADSQQALGRNIDAYMTKGDFARQWRRLETEIQMTWYEHPVNQKLARLGLNEINSVWIEGSITSLPKKPLWLQGLHGDRACFNQLAEYWGIQHDAPMSNGALHPGHLHILDAWQGRLTGDALSWLQGWETLLGRVTESDAYSNTHFVLAGEQQLMSLSSKKASRSSLFKDLQRRLGFTSGKASKNRTMFDRAMSSGETSQ